MFIFTIIFGLFSLSLLADSLVARKLDEKDDRVFDITPKDKLDDISVDFQIRKRSEDESPWLTWEKTYEIDSFSFYTVLGSTPKPSGFTRMFGYWNKPPPPPIIPVLEFKPYFVSDIYCPQSLPVDSKGKKFWIYKRSTSKQYRAAARSPKDVKRLQHYLLVLFAAIREERKVKIVFDNKHCLIDKTFRILSIKLAEYK